MQQASMQPLPRVNQPTLGTADKHDSSAHAHQTTAGDKGELAEYFGVSWTPEVTSRSPGGRIRRAVGRFSTVNGSPAKCVSPHHCYICYDQKAQHLSLPNANTMQRLSVMKHVTPGEGWRGQLRALRQIALVCRPGDDASPGSAQGVLGSPFPATPRSVQPPSWEGPAHDPDARHAGAAGMQHSSLAMAILLTSHHILSLLPWQVFAVCTISNGHRSRHSISYSGQGGVVAACTA